MASWVLWAWCNSYYLKERLRPLLFLLRNFLVNDPFKEVKKYESI